MVNQNSVQAKSFTQTRYKGNNYWLITIKTPTNSRTAVYMKLYLKPPDEDDKDDNNIWGNYSSLSVLLKDNARRDPILKLQSRTSVRPARIKSYNVELLKTTCDALIILPQDRTMTTCTSSSPCGLQRQGTGLNNKTLYNSDRENRLPCTECRVQ